MRVLVSVRDAAEARLAACAGVDFIDLKDPAAGALGGLAPSRIREIVALLEADSPGCTTSATIGDWLPQHADAVLDRVAEVAACGVRYVKVGLPGTGGEAAEGLLAALAACGFPVVPVLIADDGLAMDFVARAARAGFPALMADTQRKTGGSLLQCCPREQLAALIGAARAAGRPVGLAGALSLADLPGLRGLGPDFAGFRSAVCEGCRSDALSPRRLEDLMGALRSRPASALAG